MRWLKTKLRRAVVANFALLFFFFTLAFLFNLRFTNAASASVSWKHFSNRINACAANFKELGLAPGQLAWVRETKDAWHEVLRVMPDGSVSSVKVEKNSQGLNSVLELQPEANPDFIALFQQSVDAYPSIVQFYTKVAMQHKAGYEHRLKKPDSLLQKVFDRTAKANESFNVNLAADIIGIRFVLPDGHPMLSNSISKQDWAKFLNTKKYRIIEIENKGDKADQFKNKWYRATHIKLYSETGVLHEVQIMSKAVKYWHAWDHDLVYKSQNLEMQLQHLNTEQLEAYKRALGQYSKELIRLIRLFEDYKFAKSAEKKQNAERELRKIFGQYSLNFMSQQEGLMFRINERLLHSFEIEQMHSFFQADTKLNPRGREAILYFKFF